MPRSTEEKKYLCENFAQSNCNGLNTPAIISCAGFGGGCVVVGNNKEHALLCLEFDEGRCVYPEMDLLETFTRIAARPHIQLQEDFLSIEPDNAERIGTCPPEDWACILLNGEETKPANTRRIVLPEDNEQQQNIDALRSGIYNQILEEQTSSEPFPYAGDPTELLPSVDIEPSIDLSPVPVTDTP